MKKLFILLIPLFIFSNSCVTQPKIDTFRSTYVMCNPKIIKEKNSKVTMYVSKGYSQDSVVMFRIIEDSQHTDKVHIIKERDKYICSLLYWTSNNSFSRYLYRAPTDSLLIEVEKSKRTNLIFAITIKTDGERILCSYLNSQNY